MKVKFNNYLNFLILVYKANWNIINIKLYKNLNKLIIILIINLYYLKISYISYILIFNLSYFFIKIYIYMYIYIFIFINI